MSLSYTIDHVVTTTESVNVEVAAKSEMTLVSSDTDPKTGEITSTYVLASGEAAYPATIVYRVLDQKRASGPIRRISLTFSTWASVTDSVTGVIIRKPINASISLNVPTDITTELGDIMQLCGNLFSFLYGSVTTGTRSTVYLQRLLYGTPMVA